MDLFGNPKRPRVNLVGGLGLSILAGVELGFLAAESLLASRSPSWVDLCLVLGLGIGGVMQFRLGYKAVPRGGEEHGPGPS